MPADNAISGTTPPPKKRGAALIQKQVRLPLSKAAEIALRSLRVRFTRSVLTLITIVMAVSFLMFEWASSRWEPPIQTAVDQAKGVVAVHLSNPSRTAWLISLSLLVCLVGISNAMLMSVMERFREIGTMKCLGALDTFILKLFLLESVFLGAAGTVIGIIGGTGLTLLVLISKYGELVWRNLPWSTLPVIAISSLFIGIVITAAAAMYPAWKAARMEPISAMRVDV